MNHHPENILRKNLPPEQTRAGAPEDQRSRIELMCLGRLRAQTHQHWLLTLICRELQLMCWVSTTHSALGGNQDKTGHGKPITEPIHVRWTMSEQLVAHLSFIMMI